jgi:hypothetical protein
MADEAALRRGTAALGEVLRRRGTSGRRDRVPI